MPNWCINKVTLVHQDTEVIQKLYDLISAGEKKGDESLGLFSVFCPRPPEKEDDWYNWNVSNWGTKWDVPFDNVECSLGAKGVLTLDFQTAWAPPIEFYEYIAENNGFEVSAGYLEPGMAFCGHYNSDGDVDAQYELPESVLNAEDFKYLDDTSLELRRLIEWWTEHLRDYEEEEATEDAAEAEAESVASNEEAEPNGGGEILLRGPEMAVEVTVNKEEEVAGEPPLEKEQKNVENE